MQTNQNSFRTLLTGKADVFCFFKRRQQQQKQRACFDCQTIKSDRFIFDETENGLSECSTSCVGRKMKNYNGGR